MWNIEEALIKGNRGGPYKARYDQAKATIAAAHSDYKPMRCHNHGHLLCGKLLLKHLWIEWTGGAIIDDTDSPAASPSTAEAAR
jgi:hypothetical protein